MAKTIESVKLELTGDELQAVMAGLGELPAKVSRKALNSIEIQVNGILKEAEVEESEEEESK